VCLPRAALYPQPKTQVIPEVQQPLALAILNIPVVLVVKAQVLLKAALAALAALTVMAQQGAIITPQALDQQGALAAAAVMEEVPQAGQVRLRLAVLAVITHLVRAAVRVLRLLLRLLLVHQAAAAAAVFKQQTVLVQQAAQVMNGL